MQANGFAPAMGYTRDELPYKVRLDRALPDHLIWLKDRKSAFNYDVVPGIDGSVFACDFFFEDEAEAALFRLLFA